ncbi:21802_t:CDS:2 [Rhizophagus irregularis]|uniref:Uncharacterized protein n=1 Tax=Rhizophagus irregularis (strain DAOM 181602 / DAOM 197198 / MUCL 43194) TaxID=747089 RepID=U9SSS9_RHIID|nr:21802_t:CDS:2 [Rhizophagus irregularis]
MNIKAFFAIFVIAISITSTTVSAQRCPPECYPKFPRGCFYHPIDVEQHQVYGPPGTVYRYAEYALIMQSISTPSPSPSPPPSNKRERD